MNIFRTRKAKHRAAEFLTGFHATHAKTGPVLFESPRFLHRHFVDAGMLSRDFGMMLVRLAAAICVSMTVAIALRFPFAILIIPGVAAFEAVLTSRRIIGRASLFERDYTGLLVSLASSVRAGIDPLTALAEAGRLFCDDSLVKRECEALRRSIDSGASEREAISCFASSIRHPDIALFRAAFFLARREGSSLGRCLHRLARVTRQRQSFRRKTRAAVAMQRLSAFGIAACAIAIGTLQASTNPRALGLAFHNPLGRSAIFGGAVLLASGLIWMLALSRMRI